MGPDYLTGRGPVHLAFRVLETVGVVGTAAVSRMVAARTAEGPSTHGVGAIGGLSVVIGALVATGAVVVLHAGVLLGLDVVGRGDPESAP